MTAVLSALPHRIQALTTTRARARFSIRRYVAVGSPSRCAYNRLAYTRPE